MLKTLLVIATLLLSIPTFALTNSTPAESLDWSAVVQIKSEAPDASGDTTPSYCNGTFIGKNVLITAAHCVKLAYLSNFSLITIQTGYYKYITKQDGSLVRIGYVPKKTFDKNVNIVLPRSLIDKFSSRGEKTKIGPNEDVAILWWDSETPEINDMEFAETVTLNEHSQIIKNLRNYQLNPVSINLISEMSTNTKRMSTLDNFKWNNGHVHSKSLSRVEEGDSGAPLFIKLNNKNKIFAIVKGKATTLFDNWDVYPTVANHLCNLNKDLPSHLKLKNCFD